MERTTRAAIEACQGLTDNLEIIIVDDGSKDRTGEIADRLAAENSVVRVIHNKPNQGYGGALQAGFRAATKEWVFYTDGDGQFDFHEIPKLVEQLGHYDIVSAYRIDRRDSLIRRFNGWSWSMLCNIILGMRIRDIDCAFKIYPKRLFNEIQMKSQGALIDAEILGRANRRGYRIGQIGVHHYPRVAGEPTGGNLKVIARAFIELIRLRGEIVAEKAL